MARKYCHKQESGLTFFLDFLMSLCNCHISDLGHFSAMCHSVSSGEGGWVWGGEPPHSLINFTGSIQTSGGSRISVGGVHPLGGRGPPTWALFGENVCENERIGSHRGRAPGTPPRSANADCHLISATYTHDTQA